MLINAELLLQYHRCKRRPYLDIHGDFRETDGANDLLLKLQQDKLLYQKTIVSQWNFYKPSYPQGDWNRAKVATLELMQQGVECIYHGVLLTQYSDVQWYPHELTDAENITDTDAENLSATSPISPCLRFPSASPISPNLERYTLLSRPDLLIKKPGQSCFGDWMYVPVNIELGKRPKLEYQTVAAFHTQVVAMVQQAEPETPWLILRGKQTRYPVDLMKAMPQMQRMLWELIQTLERQQAPEVFISRQKCNLCHWYSSCYAIAQSQKHLSLLPGVTPVRYTQLQALNITTLESLAKTSPTLLENLPGFDSEVACKIVIQAQAVLENRPLILPCQDKISTIEDDATTNETMVVSGIYPKLNSLLLSPQQINYLSVNNSHPDISLTAPIEFYFDIEAQPDLNLDYLLGVLVVDRQTNTEQFYSFLAEKPEDEELIWQQFLDLVWQYPDAPIYHFCVYESDTVKRLGKLYRTPHAVVQPILNRFVDVYEKLTQSVALPVESYALKAIARWLGFEWRNPEASGAKCIYWYDQWLRTGDRTLLEKIQSYNEDDCRATRSVKDWLVNFFAD